jgi:hypothetical protein
MSGGACTWRDHDVDRRGTIVEAPVATVVIPGLSGLPGLLED